MTLHVLMYHEPQHVSCVGLYRSEPEALKAAAQDFYGNADFEFRVDRDGHGLTLRDDDNDEIMYRVDEKEEP